MYGIYSIWYRQERQFATRIQNLDKLTKYLNQFRAIAAILSLHIYTYMAYMLYDGHRVQVHRTSSHRLFRMHFALIIQMSQRVGEIIINYRKTTPSSEDLIRLF